MFPPRTARLYPTIGSHFVPEEYLMRRPTLHSPGNLICSFGSYCMRKCDFPLDYEVRFPHELFQSRFEFSSQRGSLRLRQLPEFLPERFPIKAHCKIILNTGQSDLVGSLLESYFSETYALQLFSLRSRIRVAIAYMLRCGERHTLAPEPLCGIGGSMA